MLFRSPFTTNDIVQATTAGRKTLGAQSAAAGLTDAEAKRLKELEEKERAAK